MRALAMFSCVVFSSTLSWGQSLLLKSGEIVEGEIVAAPKTLSIQTPTGEKREVPFSDILSYQKETPKKTQETQESDKNVAEDSGIAIPPVQDLADLEKQDLRFSTPENTFEVWKEAALSGDIKLMTECYVSYLQKDIKKGLKKLSKKVRRDMAKTTAMTNFIPDQASYPSPTTASLDITWNRGEHIQTQTLRFQKEKDQWKLLE